MFNSKFVAAITTGKCARFTLSMPVGHYTYKITATNFGSTKNPVRNFAFMLTGQDNGEDSGSWTYLGEIRNNELRFTNKTGVGMEHSAPFKLLNRIVCRLATNEYDIIEKAGYKLLHLGYCLRCNAELTVPRSIEQGYGPTCIRYVS